MTFSSAIAETEQHTNKSQTIQRTSLLLVKIPEASRLPTPVRFWSLILSKHSDRSRETVFPVPSQKRAAGVSQTMDDTSL
ncbi:MAG: hypothetical protein DWH81_05380 [Planctomycetota bacterium]|nr:MAG: hypothetical protein DWH81_05380 [Planctomycetota bacterium]